MSSTEQPTVFAAFTLNSENMSKSAINTVRTTLGISGAIALIIGIFITFWPKTAADVLTVLLAIYFLIAGLAYVGLGIFSKGISGPGTSGPSRSPILSTTPSLLCNVKPGKVLRSHPRREGNALNLLAVTAGRWHQSVSRSLLHGPAA